VAFRAALERARRQVQLNPRDVRAQTAVASYRADLGDSARARAALDEAVALARSAGSGRPAGTGGTSAGVDVQMRIGAVFAVLGDSSRAYTWFRRAVRNGYRFKQKARYPRLSFLWDDPAFRALVQQSRRDS
jgi:tetratricopeptide (TPR) repeat protein